MISVEPCASAKLCVELRDTYPSNLDVPRRMTRPVRRGVRCMGGSQEGEHTLSRISIRFSASVRLMPSDDCSTCNAADTTDGITCASTPSFARSSEAMGRDSDEPLLVSGQCPRWGLRLTVRDLDSGGHANIRTSERVRGRKADCASCEAAPTVFSGPRVGHEPGSWHTAFIWVLNAGQACNHRSSTPALLSQLQASGPPYCWTRVRRAERIH